MLIRCLLTFRCAKKTIYLLTDSKTRSSMSVHALEIKMKEIVAAIVERDPKHIVDGRLVNMLNEKEQSKKQ